VLLLLGGTMLAQRGHVTMNFDSLADFSLSFGSWHAVDVDGDTTYGIQNHSFPHASAPMAFLAFNPAQVTPSMAGDTAIQPHSGARYGASFSSVTPPSNDWFISPKVQLSSNGSFSVWVKSYTAQYGLEQYKVAVSTTDSLPSSFTVITGALPLEAPAAWTKKTFSLAAYNNQKVFIAIQCVSNDKFIFMIDDLDIDPGNNGLPVSVALDFESVPDFTLNFDPWTVRDLGGGDTWGITGSSFPNNGSPMAWICFDPQQATPPPANMDPHSGIKMGACFSTKPPSNPNNKWLISPQLALQPNAKISLWVRTYNTEYGLEEYKVAVSTSDDDPAHFTAVSGNTALAAPGTWTRKVFDLSAYAGQNGYVGIQCVSNNQFIFLIDDIEISSTLGIEEAAASNAMMNVYPNPATDRLFLQFSRPVPKDLSVQLINSLGRCVRSFAFTSGSGDPELDIRDLPQGVYLIVACGDELRMISKVIIK